MTQHTVNIFLIRYKLQGVSQTQEFLKDTFRTNLRYVQEPIKILLESVHAIVKVSVIKRPHFCFLWDGRNLNEIVLTGNPGSKLVS
jgi:hypothetical protein